MSEKSIIELAAKAIGYEIRYNGTHDCKLFSNGQFVHFWNPLGNDGDALRLAIQLGIDINFHIDCVETARSMSCYIKEDYMLDKYAATRIAIVRAAAEIGKTK